MRYGNIAGEIFHFFLIIRLDGACILEPNGNFNWDGTSVKK